MMTKLPEKRTLINIEYEVVWPWVHAGALASGCAAFAIPANAPALSWACIGVLVWFYAVYLGFKSYQGEWVEVPVISDLVRNQGWA